jgi:hypothetical protein
VLDNDKSHKSVDGVSRVVLMLMDGMIMRVQAVGDETCWWPAFFDGEGCCHRL